MLVRPRQPLGPSAERPAQPMTREEYAAAYGADPADLQAVGDFARAHHLEVVESSQARRTVRLAGTADAVADALGVTLEAYEAAGQTYQRPEGNVQLPPELRPIVQGVFGLDTGPRARPAG